MSEEHHAPQTSSSFSTLLGSLKNPSSSSLSTKRDSDSESGDGDSFALVNEYSTRIKRKCLNAKDGGFITQGIESLGSMKAFNLSSLSGKEKKKDLEKPGQPRSGKFAGLFGMNNGEPESNKEKERKENKPANGKLETTNEKQEFNEKKLETPAITVELSGNAIIHDSIGWNRKGSQKYKERISPHIKYGEN